MSGRGGPAKASVTSRERQNDIQDIHANHRFQFRAVRLDLTNFPDLPLREEMVDPRPVEDGVDGVSLPLERLCG
jgi:hypothetical protein